MTTTTSKIQRTDIRRGDILVIDGQHIEVTDVLHFFGVSDLWIRLSPSGIDFAKEIRGNVEVEVVR